MTGYNNKFGGMFGAVSSIPEVLLFDLFGDTNLGISIPRKLRTAYTGKHLFLRRADGATTDTDFVNNRFDTAGINTWIGSQSAWIRKAYGQDLIGNDAEQTIEANQPRIALNGVIETVNGNPAMFCDGVNDFLDADTVNGGTKPANFNQYAVFSNDDVSVYSAVFNSRPSGGDSFKGSYGGVQIYDGGKFVKEISIGTDGIVYATDNDVVFNSTQHIVSLTYTTGDNQHTLYVDGGSDEPSTYFQGGAVTTNSGTEYKTSIGKIGEGSGGFFTGHIQEVVSRNVDGVSDRIDIRDNMNSFYNAF